MKKQAKRPLTIAVLLSAAAIHTSAVELVWTNLAGGTWATAANWSPNQLPTANDTAFITNNAAFTVTVGAAAVVSNLFLGPGPGASVSNRFDQNAALTVHGTAWVQSNGWFRMSGQLNISNQFNNAGFLQWLDSPMRGSGTFINRSSGLLHTRSAGVSTLGVRVFENFGRFIVGSDDAGVQFASNTVLTNHVGGEVQIDVACYGLRDASGATGTRVVNHGLIRATEYANACPPYLTVFLLNYGTLSLETATWYLGAGTNYGAIVTTAASRSLSTVANEPFVFEAGTTFSTPAPRLWAGGHFMFNTPLTINSSGLHVGDASDGASTTAPALTINADLTLNGDVSVASGRIMLLNPAARVFFDQISIADNGVVGDANPYITNAASLTVKTYIQSFGTTDNAGRISVRTNLNFNTGSFRSAGGVIILESNSSSTFSGANGKSFNGQSVTNRGTVTATAAVSFFNGASWVNEPGGVLNANGGTFDDTGTAGSFLNLGTVRRTANAASGGVDLIFTNAGGLVSLQNGTMTIGRFTQTSGRTELRGGDLGGTLTLLGGTLDGAGDVGSVINGATVLPGNTVGIIHPTGGYTNLASGVYQMQIGGNGASQYDRITVAGSANLAGTLNVTFTNGFFPTLGNTFTAMTWTVRSGAFDQILTPNYQFEVLYTATNLLLRASNALPNVALTISGGNTQLVCNPFKLTATASDVDGMVTNLTLSIDGSVVATSGGTPVSTHAEMDFPSKVSVVATAQDDRNGRQSATQAVHLVTLPVHWLTLGGVRSNGFKICMVGENGSNYLVLASTNVALPQGDWTPIGLMEVTNGIWRYFDAGTVTNRSMRYYRAQQVP